MKILFIHPFIQLGGGEQVIIRLANYFSSKGHNVAIACAFVDTAHVGEIDSTVVLLTPGNTISSLSKAHKLLLAVIGLPALLILVIWKSFSFDVLFPHNFPAIFFAAVTVFFSRKKIVWEFNEGAPMPKQFYFFETLVGKKADEIIVLDDKNKKKVYERFGKKAITIHPGVDFAFWSKKTKKDIRLAKKITLLSVGKLHPQKNQIMLLDVVKQLAEKIPNIHLVLVGKGPDEVRLRKYVKELHVEKKVSFFGIVSNEELRSLYATAFLVCFPAFDQTWGLTPFEALCQQTVSVVSQEAGAVEVLGPKKIAFIAKPTVTGFTEAIWYAAEHVQEVKKIGGRGQVYVHKKMTWDMFCADVLSIVSSIKK